MNLQKNNKSIIYLIIAIISLIILLVGAMIISLNITKIKHGNKKLKESKKYPDKTVFYHRIFL